MTLNGETVTFEVDTGCGFTILNMETFKEKVKNAPPLKKICLKMRTYKKQKIRVMGKKCESELQTARKDIAHHSS